jgi:Protein of unknown function (DUF2971)
MADDSLLRFIPNELNQEIEAKNGHIPETLFHYTDGGAVIGMIQNKELWATSVQYMNDPNELHFVIDEVISYCEAKMKDLPERKPTPLLIAEPGSHPKEDIENEMAICVLEDTIGVLKSRTKSYEQICLISLSKKGDLLSQWRAYASNGGYSIGFSRDCLQELAVSQEKIKISQYQDGKEVSFWEHKPFYKLLPCIYTKREEQKRYALQTIDTALEFLKKNAYKWVLEQETTHQQAYSVMRDLGNEVGDGIIWLSAILKDASFEEEQEWRLVSKPIRYEDLSYRSRGSLIVPFHKFSLTKADAKTEPVSAIKEIYIGPGSDREKRLSAQTLAGLFRRNKIAINDEAIKITDTTFTRNL